jgi:cytochrome P450
LFQSGDAHGRLRKLITKVFTPRAVQALVPRVERLVEALLAPALARWGRPALKAAAKGGLAAYDAARAAGGDEAAVGHQAPDLRRSAYRRSAPAATNSTPSRIPRASGPPPRASVAAIITSPTTNRSAPNSRVDR